MEPRQRLGELSKLQKQRGLSAAEWWECSALLGEIGDHDQAKQAADRARHAQAADAPAVAAAGPEPSVVSQVIGCGLVAVMVFALLATCSMESPEAQRQEERSYELKLRPIDAKVDEMLQGNGSVSSFWEINHVRVRLVWESVLPELEAKELGMAALNAYLGSLPRSTTVYVTVLSPNNLKLAEVHDRRF